MTTNTPQLDSEELRDAVQMWVELAVHKFHAAYGAVILGDCSGESVTEIMAIIAADRAAFADRVLAVLPEKLQLYHLHSCHSRAAWVRGMTEPFPCDCGLLTAITNLVAAPTSGDKGETE